MKKLFAFLLASVILMTSIYILPVYAEVTVENFEAFTFEACYQGGGDGWQRLLVKKEQFPFDVSDASELVGLYINGTATDPNGLTTFEFQNVVTTAAEIRTSEYAIDFASQSGFDTSGSTTYSYNLTLSRGQMEITTTPDEGDDETGDNEITIDNFEPFTLDIHTKGGGSGYQRFLIRKACIPFEVTSTTSFVGFYLNGTATDTNGNVVTFDNVQIIASNFARTDNYHDVDFPIQAELTASSYTYNITLSRTALTDEGKVITIDNFEPFTLDIHTKGGGSGYQRFLIRKACIPFEVTSTTSFVGFYLNGTATDTNGNVVTFDNVQIIASNFARTDNYHDVDFPIQAELTASSYTYNITLSRTAQESSGGDSGDDNTGEEEQAVFDPYNFTPFALNVTTDGADGLKRLVVSASCFPIPLTYENQIVGCLLNGTATPTARGIENGYTETITFEDVMVEKSAIRTDSTPAYDVEFTAFGGLPTTGGYYTYDLTLSPKPLPTVDFPEDSSTFFIHPDQFSKTGNWTTETESGKYVLYGSPSILGTASALVVIPEDGTYTVKGYARDYLNDSATYRYMDVEINGVKGERIGDHETEGYVWENIGTYEFKKGDEVLVEIVKAGGWPRLAGICFSTASDYTPDDAHMEENFNKASATLAFQPLDETKINLLVLPEDFDTDLGTWISATDNERNILSGLTSGTAKEATASINITTGGIYYIWGYSKDNSTSGQGTRTMKLGVNGTVLDGEIGVFGAETETDADGAYGWDYAGRVWLSKDSKMMISLIDSSVNGAKFAAAMITSDTNFKGISEKNFATYAENSAFRASVNKDFIDISGINSYGNKLSFTLKNRTANAIENGALVYAVYTKEGKMADVSYTAFEDLDAYSGLEKTDHIFSSTETWAKGKIMLWDGLSTMKPLIEVQNFTFSEEDKTNPDENAGGDFGTVTDYDIDYVFRNAEYEAKEFNIRDGMKNTIAKLQRGEDVTVAYVGGSITEGETWRPLTTAWLKQQYPNANITEVEIGMSGTGADLAACRLDEEILAYNPDLLFVEYAANTGEEKDVEGIARKLWAHDATADLCIVYVSQTYNFGLYQNGQMPAIPTAFEKVAEHLNIPSIFFVYHPLDLYENDELTLTGKEEGKVLYTTDTIHMTKDGGYLAASAIARCILKQAESVDASYQITAHTVPSDYTLGGTYYPWSEASSSDDWSKMKFTGTWLDCSRDASGNLQNFTHGNASTSFALFDNMTGTKTPGSSITIKFKGTDIGIFEAGGQYSGQVKVTIDGVEQANSWQLYDANYDSKLRYQYNFYQSLPYGEHTVTFTLDSTMPDKSKLQAQYPSDSTYQLNELYIGRILLNGVLLDANE